MHDKKLRNKWMIGTGCVVLLCLLLCATYFNSRETAKHESSGQISEIELDNALKNALEAPILDVNNESIETPAFLYTIESRNGYEILSFERTQEGIAVTVRVYAPDVYSVAKELDAANVYEDANSLMNALDDALKVVQIKEKEIALLYTIAEDGYDPVLSLEFLDAYYGGVYQLRNDLLAALAEEAEGYE